MEKQVERHHAVTHTVMHTVTFGDCDPAGILFYPNHYRFMDATFQAWLRSRGLSQAELCARLGAVGTGLLDATAAFRAPVHDGDQLVQAMTIRAWGERTFTVAYRGTVGDRLAVDGTETRGLFRREGERLRLSPLGPLRDLLGV